jgi:hypothetical protein
MRIFSKNFGETTTYHWSDKSYHMTVIPLLSNRLRSLFCVSGEKEGKGVGMPSRFLPVLKISQKEGTSAWLVDFYWS